MMDADDVEVVNLPASHVDIIVGGLMVEASQQYGAMLDLTLWELLQAYVCRKAWKPYETPSCGFMQPAR